MFRCRSMNYSSVSFTRDYPASPIPAVRVVVCSDVPPSTASCNNFDRSPAVSKTARTALRGEYAIRACEMSTKITMTRRVVMRIFARPLALPMRRPGVRDVRPPEPQDMQQIMVRTVTVYAGSASRAPEPLLELARELGAGIAARGWILVYGGATIGLMGAVADAALAGGGRVEGVILDTFARVAHAGLHDLATVTDMRSRKAGLAHRGDAFVALPGGFGTLEELSEILVERQLGMHSKPLIAVDHAGFWAPLRHLIDGQIARGLVKEKYRSLLTFVPDVQTALARLDAAAAAPSTTEATDISKIDGEG